jgi:hypothetical protein
VKRGDVGRRCRETEIGKGRDERGRIEGTFGRLGIVGRQQQSKLERVKVDVGNAMNGVS